MVTLAHAIVGAGFTPRPHEGIRLRVSYGATSEALPYGSIFTVKKGQTVESQTMAKIERITRRPPLKLLRGYRICETKVGRLHVAAAPRDTPPFPIQAFVFEEDTFLVMSADPAPLETKLPMVKIMTRLIETQPRMPGTVVVQGQAPVRILAIVHDFNQDPSWKEAWVESALRNALQESQKLGIRSLALPFLGTVHGSLDKRRFLQILAGALQESRLPYLNRLWLVVPEGQSVQAVRDLKAVVEAQNPPQGLLPPEQP